MDYEEEREMNREAGEGGIHEWVIRTRVPSKYRLVDLETGDVWMHPAAENPKYKVITRKVLKELE